MKSNFKSCPRRYWVSHAGRGWLRRSRLLDSVAACGSAAQDLARCCRWDSQCH